MRTVYYRRLDTGLFVCRFNYDTKEYTLTSRVDDAIKFVDNPANTAAFKEIGGFEAVPVDSWTVGGSSIVSTKDLGPLLVQTHYSRMENAKRDLCSSLNNWQRSHTLTSSELLYLLADSLRSLGDRCVAIERRRIEREQAPE